MKLIVIETFWTPTICTNEEGETMYFDSMEAAQEYAENCQNPTIVEV